MRKLLLTLIMGFFAVAVHSQNNIGIGTTSPRSSAMLEVKSNNQGILIPRVDTMQIVGLTALDNGLIVYDTIVGDMFVWNGSSFLSLTSGSGGATNLAGLTDVSLTAPATNNFLRYNGTNWINTSSIFPINETVPSGGTQFQLNHTGLGNTFRVTNTSPFANDYVISAEALGDAIAGYFVNNQGTATNQALYTHTLGSGPALVGLGLSNTATAARFANTTAGNTQPTLILENAGTGLGLNVVTGGVQINELGGGGQKMVVVDNNGLLDTLTIGSATSLQAAYDGGQTLITNAGNINITSSGANPVLTIDDTNENVGIGTPSPNANFQLDVVGGDISVSGVRFGAGLSGNSTNVAAGAGALNSNSTGSFNVAVGQNALAANFDGFRNVALGDFALSANTSGIQNVGVGSEALRVNQNGIWNTAIGTAALKQNEQSFNTAIGKSALEFNVNGGENTGVGISSLQNSADGRNTGLGSNSGSTLNLGSDNTFLGYNANAGVANLNNATAIGANAVVSQDNSMILGNNVSVGIGTSTPNPNADLELGSNNRGLQLNRVDTLSLSLSPSDRGMVVYDTTDNEMYVWNGTRFTLIGSASSLTDTIPANVFSARFNGSAGAGVTTVSSSHNFINSVVRTGLGSFQVTFVPGFFTETPAIVSEVDAGGVLGFESAVFSPSASGFSIVTFNPAITFLDLDFSIIAQRQGADYQASVTAPPNVVGYWESNGSDIYFDTALVGIGTNSPSVALDVLSPNFVGIRTLSGSIAQATSIALGRNTEEINLAIAAGTNQFSNSSQGGDAILRNTGGGLLLQAGGGDAAIKISPSNDVGIKTINPNPNADLTLGSNDKGLQLNRVDRATLTLGAADRGMTVYDSLTNEIIVWDGTAWISATSGGVSDEITDADNDTKIQVEKFPDEDVIRMDIAGTERWVFTDKNMFYADPDENLHIGIGAGDNTSGNTIENVMIGVLSGNLNTTGSANVALGGGSFRSNTTGSFNTSIGWNSMPQSVTGFNNSTVGNSTLGALNNGSNNSAIGSTSLNALTNGSDNTGIGFGSGQVMTTGTGNTFLGTRAVSGTTNINNSTAIGYRAVVANDNAIVLGGINGINGATSDVSVGIGTVSPNPNASLDLGHNDRGLQLNRVDRASLSLAASDRGMTVYDSVTNEIIVWDGTAWISATAGGSGWGLTGNLGTNPAINYIGSGDAQDVIFRSNNAERMRITSAGRIGINTNAPVGRFHIDAASDLTQDALEITNARDNVGSALPIGLTVTAAGQTYGINTFGRFIRFTHSTFGGVWDMGVDDNSRYFITPDGTYSSPYLTLDPGGNVGLGIQNPASRLDIAGDVRLEPSAAPGITTNKLYNVAGSLFWNGTNISSGSSGWGFTGNNLTGTETFGSNNNFPVIFTTNGIERMRITEAGNVGIGTPSPTGRLGISGGEFQIENLGQGLRHFSGPVSVGSNVDATSGWLGTFSNSPLNLFTNGLPIVTLLPGGNVGFGTTTPAHKLDVVGGNVNIGTANAYLQGNLHLISQNTVQQRVVVGATGGLFATGANNTLVGQAAGDALTTGTDNTVMGYNAGSILGTGVNNTILGSNAGVNSFNSSNNTFVGEQAGAVNTAGQNNTFIGRNTGASSLTGNANTILGSGADAANGLTNATAIGAGAIVNQSNSLILGNNVNVGIATSSPTERFDVVGNIKFSGALMPNNLSGTAGQVLTSAGPGAPPTWSAAGGSGWGLTGNTLTGTERLGSDNAQPLVFETNNIERMRINATGSIGIGTSGGSAKLTVQENLIQPSNFGIQTIVNNGTTTNTGYLNNVNGPAGSQNFGFDANASGGDVAMAVRGISASATSTNWGVSGQASGAGATNYGIYGSAFGGATNWAGYFDGNTAVVGGLAVGGTPDFGTAGQVLTSAGPGLPPTWSAAGGSGWGLTGNAGINPATNFIGTTDAQPLRFATGVGGVERMRIDATGNVGIGTSSPEARFHLAGAVANNLQAHFTQGATDGGFKLSASNGVAGGVGTKQAEFGMFYSGSGYGSSLNFYRGSGATDGSLAINTNGAERMRIDATGNVGIGTTAPSSRIDVQNGDIIVRGIPGFGSVNDRATVYMGDNNNSIAAVNGSGIRFSAFNALDMVTFQQVTGNVGIGTTNPATKLSVAPGLGYPAPTLGVASGAFSILSDNGLYGLYSGVSTDGNTWFQAMRNDATATAYNILLNPSGGNVGIGTASPAYRLDLANGSFGFGTSNSRTETRDDAGLQGSAGAQSGFFETPSPVNYPAGASSWWHLIDARHSNSTNNYSLQIAGSFFDQELWFRKTNNSTTTPWSRLLSTANGWTTTGNTGTNPINNFVGTTDAVDMAFRTSNAERMRISSGGNVGIGTTFLPEKLNVSGGTNSGIMISSSDGFGGPTSSRLVIQASSGLYIFPNMAPEWTIGAYSGGELELRRRSASNVVPQPRYRFDNGAFLPSIDGGANLGGSANRWFIVYAFNGTINTSDSRLKKNIKNIDYGLEEIMKLRPVSYSWKDRDTGTKLGLIAQETEEIIPEVVSKPEDKNGHYGLYYSDLVPVLIKAAQELNAKIETLQKENVELRGANNQLKKEVTTIKEMQETELAVLKKQMEEVLRLLGTEAKLEE